MGKTVYLAIPEEDIDHLDRVITLMQYGIQNVPCLPGMTEFEAVKAAYAALPLAKGSE